METISIIDGHNLLFKSFAVPFEFSSKKGIPLHVVTVFLNLLRKSILLSENPNQCIVVFDSEGKNSNSKISETYKSNRIKDYSKLKDSPFHHLPLIKEALDFISIPWIEIRGVEADDVIATISEKVATLEFGKATIVSTDSDFFQLLGNNGVRILRILNKSKYYFADQNWFCNQYGFHPENYVKYKSYVGDPTDNIVGIKGIGHMRATEIIQGKREKVLTSEEGKVIRINEKLIRLNKNLDIEIPKIAIDYRLIGISNKKLFESCGF